MTVRKLIEGDGTKRKAILDAALELFAERGFHGTTVPDVADRAALGVGTVYRYFENKESLVNALFQMWKEAFGQRLITDLPVEGPVKATFHLLWTRMCDFGREHPKVLAFLELHHHRAYLDERSRLVERSILEPVRHFVINAQAQQALRAGQPEVLMAIVHGGFTGVLRAAAEGYLQLDEKTLTEAERCIWEAIRA